MKVKKPTNKQELINHLKKSDASYKESLIRILSEMNITSLDSGYYELEQIGQQEFILRAYSKNDSWAIKITI